MDIVVAVLDPCGPAASTVRLLGAVFMLSMSLAIMVLVIARKRFTEGVKDMQAKNPLAHLEPDVEKFRHSFQISLPTCGVVMPVKGIHGQSYANWRAQARIATCPRRAALGRPSSHCARAVFARADHQHVRGSARLLLLRREHRRPGLPAHPEAATRESRDEDTPPRRGPLRRVALPA